MNIGVLGSGRGTNLQAIIDAVEAGNLPVKISIVLSDIEDAFILERARKHNIPARFIPPGKFKTRLEPKQEARYIDALKNEGVDLVVLAGFMRILKERFVDAFQNRILNIHPALLPSFKGLSAWRQALDYGVKIAGCTVHLVDMSMDAGPIVLQAGVPVKQNDTPELLHKRIQIEERKIYPEAIRLFAGHKLEIQGRKVIIKG